MNYNYDEYDDYDHEGKLYWMLFSDDATWQGMVVERLRHSLIQSRGLPAQYPTAIPRAQEKSPDYCRDNTLHFDWRCRVTFAFGFR